MRILYSVQRYGSEIVGGSESACRMFSEKLVARGHEVEVITSCARSYVDWADELAPGTTVENGVVVHRLPVVNPRSDALFGPIHHHAMQHPGRLPLSEQQRWARLMGPELRGFGEWLLSNQGRFDVAVFMTYLYSTTTSGLPTLAGRLPTILQPTAHDEPPVYVSLYKSIFRQPDAFLFFTPEEKSIVRRIFGIEPHGPTIGIGIDQHHPEGKADEFRRRFALGDDPFLLYVGRLDRSKGVGELVGYFRALKERSTSRLRLVLAGDAKMEMPDHPDITVTGFLDEQEKRDALSGALALVQPSYFESFSIVLCESWAQMRPALVQGMCEVLEGQAVRSGGAIPYRGFAEFEASVHLLLETAGLADEMGKAGKDYVTRMYDWDRVMGEFETCLQLATDRFSRRR